MFKNLIDIIAAPREAFARLREKPTILLPLLIIVLGAVSVQLGYFSLVDPDFLVDELVRQATAMTGAPEGQLREAYENTSSSLMGISSAVSVAVLLPLILLIYAGYLSLMSKFSGDDFGFRHWFSLVCWTGIPAVFSFLASWVVLLTSPDGMISQQELMPLSLNSLLFRAEGGFGAMLSQINLTQLWGLALLVFGYAQWTGRSAGTSTLIVLAPYVLIYGIWTLIILL